MNLETALIAHLKAHAGLSALIAGRVYPLVAPQGVPLPCVTVQRISTPRQYTMGNTSTICNPRVQVDCWAADAEGKPGYGVAKSVAEQVLDALNQRSGQIGAGAKVFGILVSLADNEADSYEPDTGRYRVRLDFRLMYEEGAG